MLGMLCLLYTDELIRGYFYNEMGYVNLHFTYLLTYLLAHRRSVRYLLWCSRLLSGLSSCLMHRITLKLFFFVSSFFFRPIFRLFVKAVIVRYSRSALLRAGVVYG